MLKIMKSKSKKMKDLEQILAQSKGYLHETGTNLNEFTVHKTRMKWSVDYKKRPVLTQRQLILVQYNLQYLII